MTVSAETFYGKTREPTPFMSADVRLDPHLARAWVLKPDAAGRVATLPDARRFGGGGPYFILHCNPTSAHSVDVKAQDGTVVVTLAPGDLKEILLLPNGTANGTWIVK